MTWSGDRVDFTATLRFQRITYIGSRSSTYWQLHCPPMISKLSRGQSLIHLLLITSSQCDDNSVSWFVTWNINKILFCCVLFYLYKQFKWNQLIHISIPLVIWVASLRLGRLYDCLDMAEVTFFFEPWSWWRHQMETFSVLLAFFCGEFTGPPWIPLTKASDAELWYFLWSFFDRYRSM